MREKDKYELEALRHGKQSLVSSVSQSKNTRLKARPFFFSFACFLSY